MPGGGPRPQEERARPEGAHRKTFLAKAPWERARAEKARVEEAKRLYDAGRKALDDEELANACPLFEKSHALDPKVRTQYGLAECYAATGRNVRAWKLFREIAATAKNGTQARIASERAVELERFIGKVVLSTPPASARPRGLAVRLDGEDAGAAWDETGRRATIMVDIGGHAVVATAPGKIPWRYSFPVESHEKVVEVNVPMLADELPPPQPPRSGPTRRDLAVTLGILSGVALAAGISAGVYDSLQRGENAQLLTIGILTAGGVGLGGSALLWATAPQGQKAGTSKTGSWRVVPVVGQQGAVGVVQGQF
jgi:hypothetical protein